MGYYHEIVEYLGTRDARLQFMAQCSVYLYFI